ncbi:MAG: hypothetical protein HYY18_20210 [Planctomycetes bacterium]|nr:hypothetical protein [Planctomycetota bacterium]
MEETKTAAVKPPVAPPKDRVAEAFKAIVKDAKTRPGDYVKASTVPGGGE